MQKTVSVILPTLNEEENIAELIMQVNKFAKPDEIIVVDDNSSDKTREIAAKTAKNVFVLHRKDEHGIASAIYRGVEKAKGNIVVWLDADLSMPAQVIPKMIKAITSGGYDIAIGSRYVQGGMDVRPLSRVFTSRLFNLFAQIILNFSIKDTDSGFVAAKKSVFEKVPFDIHGHGEYCIEFLYTSSRNGYAIKEIPYVFTDRARGKSKTAPNLFSLPLHGVKYCYRTIKIRLAKK